MHIDTFGKVGISTITPAAKLHVSDGTGGGIHNYNGLSEIIIEDNGSSYIQFSNLATFEAGILSGNDTTDVRSSLIFRPDSSVQIKTGGNIPQVTILKSGFMGIGIGTPSQKLHVVGNICFTGTSAACSDMRYKKNILPISNVLESLQSIHGIYYNWNKEKFTDKAFGSERQIGFSAQELETVFPEMVLTDERGYKSVDYSRMTPVLVEAIREQQEIISTLQSNAAAQQLEFNAQKTKLESLARELEELKSIIVSRE